MHSFKEIIEREETRIINVVDRIRATLSEEQKDRRKKDQEIAELKQQKLEAVGWAEKREIGEILDACRRHYQMRSYQDPKVLNQPYFGVLELDDDDLGFLSYCLGACSFFAQNGQALVIDWRDAPISRLYYEYEAGEFYEEEIRNRERSGVIRSKRQVDTTGGELRKIVEKGTLLVRGEGGAWQKADETSGVTSRKEEKADHRLPEITALISRDQFRAITRPEAGIVVLQGGAGSGKTTVGLHRIAYLTYQDPERFKPGRMLVVMFNRSLQQYISRVLPELGVGSATHIETYHSWAGKLFRTARAHITYSFEDSPPGVTRFKKNPVVLSLVDRYLEELLKKSRTWFVDQLKENQDPEVDKIASILGSATRFDSFFQLLNTHPDFLHGSQPEPRKRLRQRLLQRFYDHESDLSAVLSDRTLLEEVLESSKLNDSGMVDQLIQWQATLRDRKKMDFADTGILLWLLQRKGISVARPGYAHIMVDEAQDLSEVELATLLYAADEEQSITICGDMAQKIKGDVSFESPEGFAGFIRYHQERTEAKKVCADTLVVGYRATRPIMELAWHVLGEKPSMTVPRDGKPVEIIRTQSHEESMEKAKNFLHAYLEERPKALVGVVCRYKADADGVFEDLKRLGLEGVRRHERDDFSFQPGVIVTNAHQVKGLEFSAIVVINPSATQYRDNRESRMLLHVVLTRAADHLRLIGHQPLAYDLEEWK